MVSRQSRSTHDLMYKGQGKMYKGTMYKGQGTMYKGQGKRGWERGLGKGRKWGRDKKKTIPGGTALSG